MQRYLVTSVIPFLLFLAGALSDQRPYEVGTVSAHPMEVLHYENRATFALTISVDHAAAVHFQKIERSDEK